MGRRQDTATIFQGGVWNGVHSERKMAEKMGDFANFVVRVKNAKISEKPEITGVIRGIFDWRFLMRNLGRGCNG